MTNQYVPRHHHSIQEFHFCKLRHGKFFRDSGRDQSSLHEKRLKRNGYLTLGLRRTAMRIASGTGTLFSFLIQAINSGVSVSAITTVSLEKWFPPALSGWRAMLQPFSDPTIPALRTISLDVAPGEAVALLGANGAGKSTLLRILATLLLPTRGSASIAGHDIVKEDSTVRMQIGYHAGTDQGFYPRLSGRENLRFFGRLNHLTGSLLESRINALAAQFHCVSALDRQVRTLSSGTVQRLSLLRALLHQPCVLLLDEPTRSLDTIAASDFRRFLKTEVVAAGGTALLFASHTLHEIEFLADRVAVLHEGKLLAIESPSRLKSRFAAGSLEEAYLRLAGQALDHSGKNSAQ
jgi:ABC-type multidrug transport system ATPase subunit